MALHLIPRALRPSVQVSLSLCAPRQEDALLSGRGQSEEDDRGDEEGNSAFLVDDPVLLSLCAGSGYDLQEAQSAAAAFRHRLHEGEQTDQPLFHTR